MSAASSVVLRTETLSKRFGSLEAVRNVSLELPRGARHALIGPNGAGKTTLVNLITGQQKADAGRIHLDGVDITRAPQEQRVRHGLTRTFQINTLFPALTPIESVTLAICERERVAGQFWRNLLAHSQAIEEAFQTLKELGLAAVATRQTQTLPYGQQRLLEIALALATRPKVLLLDEPAAGVPKNESMLLFQVIAALPEDISVLFIEHDMDIVFSFASRIVVLVSGSVLIEAPPDIVRNDKAVREVYLGQGGHG